EAFATFGMGLTATSFVAQHHENDPARAGRIIALSTLVAAAAGALLGVGLLLAAPWLAGDVLAAPHLTDIMRIGAPLLFLGALNGAQTGVLAGLEAFRKLAWLNLATGFCSFPLLVGGTLAAGLHGVAWALVAVAALNWLGTHLVLRRETAARAISIDYAACTCEW